MFSRPSLSHIQFVHLPNLILILPLPALLLLFLLLLFTSLPPEQVISAAPGVSCPWVELSCSGGEKVGVRKEVGVGEGTAAEEREEIG